MFIYIGKGKRNAGYTYICLYNFDAGKIYIDMFIYIEKVKNGMLVTHIYVYIILMPVKYI